MPVTRGSLALPTGIMACADRLPDGSVQPLALPEWRWDTFYIEIIRSILEGGWDKTSGRALNYWWGMSSDAEEIQYTLGLPGGTLQMLDLMEKQLREGGLQIFPAEITQGHILHSPAGLAYTPAELMEMDWLDECVEGEMPRYEQLDVRTRTLIGINGLDNVKDGAQ